MVRVRFIPQYRIALSSMPLPSELKELSKRFKAVLVVAEDDELMYDLSEWVKLGVRYAHIPVKDFSAPHLLELYRGARWISENVSKGLDVLIHCYGGIGRSGTFASAYLIYSEGLVVREAISTVRKHVPGAVETAEQEAMLEAFELLIKALPEPKISKVVGFAEKYDYGQGVGHASKVAQLALKLWRSLAPELSLPENTITPLAVAAILHDIGRSIGDGREHHVKSCKAILASKELREVLSEKELMLAALLALYHRKEPSDPREDPKIPGKVAETLARLTGILRIADALDYTLNQAVKDIEAHIIKDKVKIKVYATNRWLTYYSVERAKEKKTLLEKITRRKVSFSITYI